MRFRSILLAATVLAVPFAAQAQPVTGLYIGGGAGANWLMQESVSSVSVAGVTAKLNGVNLTSAVGPVVEGAVGWGLGNGLRVELEGDYRTNKFQSVSSSGSSLANAGGWNQLYGPMVNVAYDFFGLTPWVVPYVGVGVGYQWANLQHFKAYSPGETVLITSNGTEGSFAYQAIVGAAMPIPMLPGLALTAEYRFLGTAGDRNYSANTAETTSTGTSNYPTTVKLGPQYNNAILIGFRYNFGVAPPPPPAPAPVAAPAPAPARSYLVFFDWDKATLTDRARQIIREAAENSTHVQYTQIEVNGYTDTSGTPQYNMGLSIRRADAVAAELVRDGVPRNVISIHGFGETHLLVPTGPGVREPQNRRVEIIIH